jgi:hypothetical protein
MKRVYGLLALLCYAALVIMLIAPSFAAEDWDGTWVGNWDKAGGGVQIIMAGNTAVGLFWRGAYVSDELHSAVSPNGSTLTITWGASNANRSNAILTRDSTGNAHVVMHEPGRGIVEFSVRLDH